MEAKVDMNNGLSIVDAPKCRTCSKPATCVGHYESMYTPEFSCSECCGHGNEDGRCEILGDVEWYYDDANDQLVAQTIGSFEARINRGADAAPTVRMDSVSIEFEVPGGRGREFIERLYEVCRRVR